MTYNQSHKPLPIEGYHIHFYCELDQTSLANEIRTGLLQSIPAIDGAGPVRDRPVGPHPLPMFEAWFKPAALNDVVTWTMAHRRGLNVLIHPISGNDLADHRDHAMWIGKPQPINLKILGG